MRPGQAIGHLTKRLHHLGQIARSFSSLPPKKITYLDIARFYYMSQICANQVNYFLTTIKVQTLAGHPAGSANPGQEIAP